VEDIKDSLDVHERRLLMLQGKDAVKGKGELFCIFHLRHHLWRTQRYSKSQSKIALEFEFCGQEKTNAAYNITKEAKNKTSQQDNHQYQ
jgi:hypothetical protein